MPLLKWMTSCLFLVRRFRSVSRYSLIVTKLPGGRQTGMPCRKRKMRVTCWSALMYTPLLENKAPGLDGMRCALVLLSEAALKDFSGLQVSRAPGSTVVPSHDSPADLAENNQLLVRSRWSADVGIANAIFQALLSQASSAGQSGCSCTRPTSGADRVHSWRAQPRPCVPAYWLRPRRLRYGGCVL